MSFCNQLQSIVLTMLTFLLSLLLNEKVPAIWSLKILPLSINTPLPTLMMFSLLPRNQHLLKLIQLHILVSTFIRSINSFFFRYLFLQSHLSLISNSLCQIIITWLFPFCFRSYSHKINLVCNPCLSSLLVASFDLLLTNHLSLIFSSTVFLIRSSWC